ncbi:MAG: hypothetical protein IPK06_09745 [Ignavibacteriae bacterium]|nr:hypothetical protein [Ignavibacteriota bacterium]
MILINLDTKKNLIFDKFKEIERSNFILFKGGKNIFVESYNSTGEVFIYDIENNSQYDIDKSRNGMSEFNSINIIKNHFYYASQNKIFSYSLNDFKLQKEYVVDSLLNQFIVYNENLIAFNYSIFDEVNNGIRPSYIYLKDFIRNSYKVFPYYALFNDLSKNKQKLLFNSEGPKIMDYPSMEVHSIGAIERDSLEIFGLIRFIGEDEIIFSGYKKGTDRFETTNLYLLNLNTNKIEQITNTKSVKELKSVYY